jgi:hypothetical protein
VKVDNKGDISIEPQEESKQGIYLNWRRLHNMAHPIVKEQLGRLAIMNQNWRDTPMKLNLVSSLW